MTAPLPLSPPLREAERLSALYRYEILDTPPEKELDDLVHLAAYICHTPIAVISLVDSNRQWFKSKIGLTATETSRYIAFCAHTILSPDILIVPDALEDERFVTNPLVTGNPHIRFYCGAPLVTSDGYRIGTLSVIDHVPRTLSAEQQETLQTLSRQVIKHWMLDRSLKDVTHAHRSLAEAHDQLRRSEEKFRALNESSPSAIFIYRDDRIVYANQAAASISGYSIEELLTMDIWKMTHPDFLPFLQARARATQESDIGPAHYEFQIITKDGQMRWLDFTAATIDYEGRPARLATGYDITARRQTERKLAEREGMLQQIFDAEPECVKLLAAGGILLNMNRAGLAMLEADTPEQVMNQCIYPLITEPYRSRFQALTERVFQGESGILEFEILGLKGGHRWLESHAAPMRGKTGTVTALLSVTRDITEHKRTSALLETDKRVLELIASGAALTEVLERLCRMFEDMSPGLLSSILLLDQDRLCLRHGAAPSLPPAYRAAIDGERIGPGAGSCGTAAYLRRQIVVTDIANDPLWTGYRELALKHQLGACWSTPIFSKDSSVLGTFAMYYREPRSPGAHDLQIIEHATKLASIAIERARAEEELRVSEERFALAVRGTNDGIWDWNIPSNEDYLSPRWKELLGFEDDELPNHADSFITRLHPEDLPRAQEAVRAHLEHRVPYDLEVRLRHKDGSYRWFRSRGQAVWDKTNKPVRMAGAITDITDRKRDFDALQEAYRHLQVLSREVWIAEEKERSRLSRELHDEFGQLLSALKLEVTRIANNLANKPALKPSVVRKKLTVASDMVDRLFPSLRRVIQGLRPPVLDELGILPAIQTLANEAQERSGLQCRVMADQEDFGKSFGPELEGALFRITQELLTNIVRHSKSTTATITLSCTDGLIYLTAQDDGQGFKVDSLSLKRRFGLRGVRERAELLGGKVEIQSEQGQGTAVTVSIPVSPTLQGNGSTVPSVSSRSPTSASKKKRQRHGKEV
ncbi:MAG: PAS domain S-box protein [Nitrospira sp. CG24E]|nr:MAG: PAS domain S-box protein [Nitrospira sp. CG24E]